MTAQRARAVPRDNSDTLVPFDQWTSAPLMNSSTGLGKPLHDAGRYMASVVAGYMNGPVAVVNGKHVEATTIRVGCLDALIDDLEEKNTKLALYSVYWCTAPPVFEYDEHSSTMVMNSPGEPFWLVRGAIAGDSEYTMLDFSQE